MFYIYVRSAFSRHNSCKMDVKSNNCEKSIKVQIKWIQIPLLKYKILKDSHVETLILYLSRFINTWNIPFWLEFAKNEVKWHDIVPWRIFWGGNTPKNDVQKLGFHFRCEFKMRKLESQFVFQR